MQLQVINHKINKKIFNIDDRSCCGSFLVSLQSSLSTMNFDSSHVTRDEYLKITRDLTTIDHVIKSVYELNENNYYDIYNSVAKKNNYFAHLVEFAVLCTRSPSSITGHTLNCFVGRSCIFPSLSESLGSYLAHEVGEMNLCADIILSKCTYDKINQGGYFLHESNYIEDFINEVILTPIEFDRNIQNTYDNVDKLCVLALYNSWQNSPALTELARTKTFLRCRLKNKLLRFMERANSGEELRPGYR